MKIGTQVRLKFAVRHGWRSRPTSLDIRQLFDVLMNSTF